MLILRSSQRVTRRRPLLLKTWLSALLLALVALVWPNSVPAQQNVQYTNKSVDLGLRGDFKVNPSTHGLELQIPLASYPQRGGSSLPAAISYSSKVWRIAYLAYVDMHNSTTPYTQTVAKFAEYSRAGWTFSIGAPYIDTSAQVGGNEIYDYLGQSEHQCVVHSSDDFNPNLYSCCFVDRILIRMPDGSAHELRSSDQPVCIWQDNLNPPVPDDLYSVDGARLHYRVQPTSSIFPMALIGRWRTALISIAMAIDC